MYSKTIGGLALLSLSVLMTVGGAWGASDRVEIERTAGSPNGEFRVVVAHTARNSNQLEGREAADCRLRLTLSDEVTGDVLWTREHSVTAGARCNPLVWIDDDRHVVLSSGAETMTVFHPDDGSIVLEFDLLRCFPTEDHEEFIRQTTVGPLWAANSRRFFLDVDHSRKAGGARSYFVVRPWWERHVVIDLDAGEVLRFEGMPEAGFLVEVQAARAQEVLGAIDQDDRAWVMDVLKFGAEWRSEHARWVPTALGADGRFGYMPWIPTAAHMAGRLDMEEAAPWLRIYEDSEYFGAWSNTWREYTLRQTVQLSLRRLGAEPGEFAATEIGNFTGDVPRPIRNAASRSQRVWNTRYIREGMPVKELVRLIGHPDYIAFPRGRVLDYDIDRGGEPFTLRVTLVDVDSDYRTGGIDLRVGSIERITPPIWQDSNQRDVAVTNRRFGPADPSLRTTEIGARARPGRQR